MQVEDSVHPVETRILSLKDLCNRIDTPYPFHDGFSCCFGHEIDFIDEQYISMGDL